MGVGELRRVHRHSGEHLQLHLVARESVVHVGSGDALRSARGTADEDDRHVLGKGSGGRVQDTQTSDAIGYTGRAYPLESGIGVCRITCIKLVAVAGQAESALHHPVHEIQHIVPGHAEHVFQASFFQAQNQVTTHCHFAHRVLLISGPKGVDALGL